MTIEERLDKLERELEAIKALLGTITLPGPILKDPPVPSQNLDIPAFKRRNIVVQPSR
jgi:hypothetical protein